jgi:subtilisin family serine protease
LNKFPFINQGGHLYVQTLLELKDEKYAGHLQDYGCQILVSTGKIIAARIPVNHFNEIVSKEWVIRLEASRQLYPAMDKSRADIGVDKVYNGDNLPMPLKGDGVIIGFVDGGIDFRHPDFYDEYGKTRILYIWDMSDAISVDHPAGYDWGREITKSEIDNSPADIYENDANATGGHGTMVAGVAAGGGKANPNFRGVASNADIIFVKGLRPEEENANGFYYDADIIAGCQYIFKKADELGKPAVINISLGLFMGPHDTSALLPRALSELVSNGKIIVIAASNEGKYTIHASGVNQPAKTMETFISPVNGCSIVNSCDDNDPSFWSHLDIWYEDGALDSMTVVVYNSAEDLTELAEYSFLPFNAKKGIEISNGHTVYGYLNIYPFAYETSSQDGEVYLTLGGSYVELPKHIWSVRTRGSRSAKIDMWGTVPIPDKLNVEDNTIQMIGDNSMTISSYACGKKIISVGSYSTRNTWKDVDDSDVIKSNVVGDISDFSSRGPTRDGRMVPTISAPGESIVASLSGSVLNSQYIKRENIYVDTSYRVDSGTSFSTPHVAGAIALLLQMNPRLGFDEIVDILTKSARHDEFTGSTPNNSFGAGKLDAYNAVRQEIASSTVDQNQISRKMSIYPNPANSYIIFESGEPVKTSGIEILNTMGMSAAQIIPEDAFSNSNGVSFRISTASLASGSYFLRYNNGSRFVTLPFVVAR